MTDEELARLLAVAQEGVGTRPMEIEEVEECVRYFWSKKFVISAMESTKITKDFDVPDFEFAVLGLDGNENWEEHLDVTRTTKLILNNLKLAKMSENNYVFNVWAECWPKDTAYDLPFPF